MKLFSVAALLAAVASNASAFIVNTPFNVVQCHPLLIIWDPAGSQAPYLLSVRPSDNDTVPPFFSWDGLTGTSFTWIVTVPAGQSLIISLRDSVGLGAQTAPFQVFASSTTDCSASSSVSSPVSSSTSARSISTTPSPTGSAGAGTGGALTNAVNFGSAGLLAALVGAFLV